VVSSNFVHVLERDHFPELNSSVLIFRVQKAIQNHFALGTSITTMLGNAQIGIDARYHQLDTILVSPKSTWTSKSWYRRQPKCDFTIASPEFATFDLTHIRHLPHYPLGTCRSCISRTHSVQIGGNSALGQSVRKHRDLSTRRRKF
jgi:hypothetical protein